MNKLLLVCLLVLSAGCQLDATQCAQSSDCFVGEQCEQGRCAPALVIEPRCSPQDCASELTAQTECVVGQCVVRSCAAGAARCEAGCCEAGPPAPSAAVLPVTALQPVARHDHEGAPHLWGIDERRSALRDVFWDGLRWTERVELLFPEPLGSYDVRYDAQGGVHIAYTKADDGSMWYAHRGQEGEPWETAQIAAPPEESRAQGLLFMRPRLSLSEPMSVSFLYGNKELVDGTKTRAGFPQPWFATRNNDGWSAARVEVEGSALNTIAYESLLGGAGLMALTIRSDSQIKIVFMSRDFFTSPWTRSSRFDALINSDTTSYFTEIGAMRRDPDNTIRMVYNARTAGEVMIRELIIPPSGSPTLRDVIRIPDRGMQALFAPHYMDGAGPTQLQYIDYNLLSETGRAMRSVTIEPLDMQPIPDLSTRGLWWGLSGANSVDVFYQGDTGYSYTKLER